MLFFEGFFYYIIVNDINHKDNLIDFLQHQIIKSNIRYNPFKTIIY